MDNFQGYAGLSEIMGMTKAGGSEILGKPFGNRLSGSNVHLPKQQCSNNYLERRSIE